MTKIQYNNILKKYKTTFNDLKCKKMIIYIIINTLNLKCYVGQTTSTFEKRYKNIKDIKVSNTHLSKSIHKYGKNNFKFFILKICKNLKELNKFEKYYIKYYKSNDKNFGYNMAIGGLNNVIYNERIFLSKLKNKNIHQYKILSKFKGLNYLIKFKCLNCGTISSKKAELLLYSGCKKCAQIKFIKSRKYILDDFIKLSKSKFGDKYDYSNSIYTSNKNLIKLTCKLHNISFKQTPRNHLEGKEGCFLCKKNKFEKNKYFITFKEFLKRAKKVHSNKYIYNANTYTGIKSLIEITCKKCNNVFHQEAKSHTYGCGCPKCAKYISAKKRCRKIAKIDPSTNTVIKIYESCKQAMIENKIIGKNLWFVLSGERKRCGGFKWRHV